MEQFQKRLVDHMKASEISFEQLLSFTPQEGKIFLGGLRALLVDAGALGTLRKALVDTVGFDHARRLYGQCGYACGFQEAGALRDKVAFASDNEWLLAGPLLHTRKGHVLSEPIEFRVDRAQTSLLVKARWKNSYEAEQHLRLFGQSQEPVCWHLCGYASGWASAVFGAKVLCVETRCAAQGHPDCLIEVRPLPAWDEPTRLAASWLEDPEARKNASLLDDLAESLKASRAAERRSRDELRAIMDSSADMIWIRDPKTAQILDINKVALARLGYRREDVLEKPVGMFLADQADLYLIERTATTAMREGSAYASTVLKTSAGTTIEVEWRAAPIEYGKRRALLVVTRDIGRAMEERRFATMMYQAFKRSNDVMFYCDRNGVILDVNDAFAQHYGFSRDEAIGQTPRILRSSHSTNDLYRRMWSGLLDPNKGYWRGEMINRAKDGREIPLFLTITTVRDPGGEIIGYMSNAIDLTEQKALQGRVAHSEALAVIGEMAAVMAHEIRNPLGSIVMASNQLGAGDLSAEDRAMVLKVLRTESQRLNESLSNFLAYARPREVRLSRADLNAVVGEICNIVQTNGELLKDIDISVALDPQLQPFPMDADQIRQVLWNIVLNAIQALGGRGKLTVETGRDSEHAFFRVKDTGPGIPAGTLSSIFKPFHTTKPQGTGLGLAVADRIIKAHGGAIEVTSRPGDGACFTVRLPSIGE